MDSGLEERILPSIRRSQILLIYRNGGVDNPETCGQIACSVGRLPIRFTVGTGGTIRNRRGGTIIKYPHPSVRAKEARTSTLP